jgi:hypothetical protein
MPVPAAGRARDVALSLPLSMAMLFATLLIALNDLTRSALKTSFSRASEHPLVSRVGVIIFVLVTVASIPLALGWLLFGPVLMVGLYMAYRTSFTG